VMLNNQLMLFLISTSFGQYTLSLIILIFDLNNQEINKTKKLNRQQQPEQNHHEPKLAYSAPNLHYKNDNPRSSRDKWFRK